VKWSRITISILADFLKKE